MYLEWRTWCKRDSFSVVAAGLHYGVWIDDFWPIDLLVTYCERRALLLCLFTVLIFGNSWFNCSRSSFAALGGVFLGNLGYTCGSMKIWFGLLLTGNFRNFFSLIMSLWWPWMEKGVDILFDKVALICVKHTWTSLVLLAWS